MEGDTEHIELLKHAHERREKLISLNKLEVALGCTVAVIAIAAAAGTWFVMPYRMTMAEQAIRSQAKQIEEVEKRETDTHELLVRIDERLKAVQEALAQKK